MAILPVRILGDPVLREKAKPVVEVTDELRKLIADMFDTMYAEEGVGLAGPQVGVGQRVIVVDPHEEGIEPFALVNPVITSMSEDVQRDEEGCLSIPQLKEIVERAYEVRVEGLDRDGKPVVMQAEGFLARILQHEVDHLDGVLFIDRVSALKRKLLMNKWQKVKP